MKSVIEHFDINSRSHVEAVQHFNSKGSFPSGFLTAEVNFVLGDMVHINKQIEDEGYSMLIDESVQSEETEPLNTPDGTDESIDVGESNEED